MGQFSHRPNVFQRSLHPILRTRPGGWFLARMLHHFDRLALRLSRGRHSLSSMLAGMPVVTVTTIGAKSGQPRSLPLVAIPDGENVILIASNYGQKHHPAWYYNLHAHPEVQLTYEGQTVAYVAQETSGAERERCWQRAVDLYSGYALYEERAGQRQIGVFLLTPQTK
jgi:deazaflavin-dependent oxidoreductase (nitroreductase family)